MKFEIPVYFITGAEDINCPVQLLEECFEKIEAPDKKLITLEKASHMCFYDNPEAFDKALDTATRGHVFVNHGNALEKLPFR